MKWLVVVSLVAIITCSFFPAPGHCRSQAEKLKKLFHAKLRNEIKTSQFKAEEMDSRVVVEAAGGNKEADLIVRLPGQPLVSFKQYGGYIKVDPLNDRNMYYYFAEAQHPEKDQLPLVLWLNGGPGCSSLGYGAMTELGPFRVASDAKTLYRNKYAWNRAANVVFLESPAGVGFSYSNTSTDYTTGDVNTSLDNLVFLQNWLQRFPEYKGRDFYIAGESYAGHYVPQLARNILLNNLRTHDTSINLRGIMIGNAVIHDETDNIGMYDYYANHGMASPESVAAVHKHCNFSSDFTDDQTDRCIAADRDFSIATAPIFPYNIYAEDCLLYNGPTAAPLPFSVPRACAVDRSHSQITEFDECSAYYVEDYLNRKEVQKAMHANTTNIPRPWTACSDVVQYREASTSVLGDIHNLLANNVTVWIFRYVRKSMSGRAHACILYVTYVDVDYIIYVLYFLAVVTWMEGCPLLPRSTPSKL
ncbi:unnamed protein product [Linum tenue]|uniref:Carboxypeptidase n=1 Tax=Linum tenue TaxID=586396 RepID=A0AAV0RUY1_9ROSI|nr:unnamed protein product [Linum tenue]